MTTERRSRSGPSGASIPRDQRKRRPIELTLSDAARAALDKLAKKHKGNRSAAAEAVILAAARTFKP
jgi:hypothetical protein